DVGSIWHSRCLHSERLRAPCDARLMPEPHPIRAVRAAHPTRPRHSMPGTPAFEVAAFDRPRRKFEVRRRKYEERQLLLAYTSICPVAAFQRTWRPWRSAALAMCDVRAASCPTRMLAFGTPRERMQSTQFCRCAIDPSACERT